ncbi:MAG: hypothetical protein RL541_30 [Pseudomonadota bacterium]
MQTANLTPIATAIRTIVERIQDANLELVKLAICELDTEQRLITTLGSCYNICEFLESGRNTRELYEFEAYYETTAHKNTKKVSLVSKILNCTFEDLNVSKRSAYKAVIQFAIDQGVANGEFVDFVASYGGLQNTRLAKYAAARAKSSAPTYQTRLQQTQNYFTKQQIAKVPQLALEGAVPTTRIGEPFVLIAQRTADGFVAFNVATSESKAVNAVLNIVGKDSKQQIAAAAKNSSQTISAASGTASVPPDSFAASSYSTDASSKSEVVNSILQKVAEANADASYA